MALWGGLTPENAHNHKELNRMLKAGAVGFKAFMCPSGINDFPHVSRCASLCGAHLCWTCFQQIDACVDPWVCHFPTAALEHQSAEHPENGQSCDSTVLTACSSHMIAALPVLMRHQKPLMLHAEVVSDTGAACGSDCNPRSHGIWEASRPPKFETDAAETIVSALRTVRSNMPELWANATRQARSDTLGVVHGGFAVHIAHLSSTAALQIYHNVRPHSSDSRQPHTGHISVISLDFGLQSEKGRSCIASCDGHRRHRHRRAAAHRLRRRIATEIR